MAYRFGTRSRNNLDGVHPDLVKVVTRALEICSETGGPDFAVIEGVRTPARQRWLYAQGRTRPGRKVTWTLKSNHFVNSRTGFGHAVDLFPGSWDALGPFDQIADAMMQASRELSIPIRHGADWNRNGRRRERGEHDNPHFELWGY